MRSLKFNFCHPVKGVLKLFNLNAPSQSRTLVIDQDDQVADIDVDIDKLPSGRWKAMLEWEYDGKAYFYERIFEVSV